MSLNCLFKSDPVSEISSLLPDSYWLSRFNSYQQYWKMNTWLSKQWRQRLKYLPVLEMNPISGGQEGISSLK